MTAYRSVLSAVLLAVGAVNMATASEPVAASSSAPATPDWASAHTWTPDAVFVQLGRAKETTALAAGAAWTWRRSWAVGDRARVTGYTEMSVGHWRADNGGGNAIVTQLGLTPTLRYWPTGVPRGWFYEAAIGVNVLAPVYRTNEKRFSTAFNFGDHIGVGYRSASVHGREWSLRLQHFSNAGIDRPNPGEDFVQLRLTQPL